MATAAFAVALVGAASGVADADPATPDPAPGPVATGPAPGPTPTGPAPGPTDSSPTAAVPAATDPAATDPDAPTTPPAVPKTTIDADGTYAVGTDIVPGVYSSAGPIDNGTCYWKRTGNPDGATLDNALTKKPQTVQIDPTDKSFKTDGCQPWQLTNGAAPPAPDMPPALAGLKLQAYMAQLNARAAASGQTTPTPP
jgi:hypothetical protein